MPRKRCCGLVVDEPHCGKFIPEGIADSSTVVLGVEELEAIRLKDLLGYDQSICANEMGLSRPTFQRVLRSARAKVALALVEGQTINIQGGNYMVKNRIFECSKCGHTWEVEPCTDGGKHGYEIPCPKCGSMDKLKIDAEGQKHACAGRGHAHGGGCCCGH